MPLIYSKISFLASINKLLSTGGISLEIGSFIYSTSGLNNGVYSANLPDVENGSLVAVWVSACTPSGNSSSSEKQQAIVMKSTASEPVIVITNVSDNKVHVKCAGFDSSKNQTIYLGLYSTNGKLLQIQSAKPDEDVTFGNVSSSGYVRAFIWENTDPVCKATKPILFVPDTETEND